MNQIRMLPLLLYRKFARNRYSIMWEKSEKNRVNIESFSLMNVGDTLSPLIVGWLLERRGIDPKRDVGRTKHLLAVGSILSFGGADAAVWGSGVLSRDKVRQIREKKTLYRRKLDVRAVRGPVTREVLMNAGYECPEVYGDPAVLMPLIYPGEKPDRKYDVSVILHHRTSQENGREDPYHFELGQDLTHQRPVHFIDPKTDDYRWFIDEIRSSGFVISSSLHGIILAEAYGVPAFFLNFGIEDQLDKFEDWYRSTGRELSWVKTVEEGLDAALPALPSLNGMQEKLISCFPYDLWEG